MSSEEEDYMSDKFLEKVCGGSGTKQDVRPGLVHSRVRQREYEVQSKKARIEADSKRKNFPEMQLQAGLSTALSSDNKGFAMLAKMGYKQGESLGKTGSEGITEPIPLEVKTDRAGLGRAAAIKRLQEYRENVRRKKQARSMGEEVTPEEFRQRLVQKSQEKQMEGDLRKSQKACEKMDQDEGIEEPELKWFWPERRPPRRLSQEEQEEAEAEEEEDEFETYQKLEMITDYLRTTYCYCVWCGVKYEDAADMTGNCPGSTKDDH